jgi:hypothetical protein
MRNEGHADWDFAVALPEESLAGLDLWNCLNSRKEGVTERGLIERGFANSWKEIIQSRWRNGIPLRG